MGKRVPFKTVCKRHYTESFWAVVIQETWNKELAKKAKTAMILLWWQPFGSDHLSAAVSTVVTCARDSNWHTRVAALKFLQPLIYRYCCCCESLAKIILA